MENKSLIEKLIDNTPLAIIMIGLILFLPSGCINFHVDRQETA